MGTEDVAHSCEVALLLIDVINDFDFEEAAGMIEAAEDAADKIADLAKACRSSNIPVIYVNDNFGRWRSDLRAQVESCDRDNCLGKQIASQLAPTGSDYFVLKPMHSGFHATPLEILLQRIGAKKLIMVGYAGNICVFFTANDAYMRDYEIVVPADAIASNTQEENQFALAQMSRVLKADTRATREILVDLTSWK